jgi:DME family drug/metabolite transporter
VTLALAEPATAFVLAIVVVGERPQWGAFAGLGLLLTGLGFVLWTESRGREHT